MKGGYFPLWVHKCRAVFPFTIYRVLIILAVAYLQAALLHLYVDGSDGVLWRTLRGLLTIVAVIELADGLQTVLGGVVQVSRSKGVPLCASIA